MSSFLKKETARGLAYLEMICYVGKISKKKGFLSAPPKVSRNPISK